MNINLSELSFFQLPKEEDPAKKKCSISLIWQRITQFFHLAFDKYNYNVTLKSIFRLPPRLLESSEAAVLFKKIEMHGLIAEKNQDGNPCPILNSFFAKAILRGNFVYIERFLKSGAFLSLDNWLLINELRQTRLLKWVPLTYFFFTYENELLTIAEKDAHSGEFNLLNSLLEHHIERRENVQEVAYWKKSFLKIIGVYVRNRSPFINDPVLLEWLGCHLTEEELFFFLCKYPFQSGLGLLLRNNCSNEIKFKYVLHAIKNNHIDFLKKSIKSHWLISFNFHLITEIWNAIERSNNEEIACLVYEAGLKPWNKHNLALTYWISHASKYHWNKFLKGIFRVKGELTDLFSINHPEIFQKFLQDVLKTPSNFHLLVAHALEHQMIEKIHLIFDHFSDVLLSQELMQKLADWATKDNHILLLERLFGKGLNPHHELPEKITIFNYALVNYKISFIDKLIEKNFGVEFNEAQKAVWKGFFPEGYSEKELEKIKTPFNQSLLHLAVVKGHYSLVKHFLKQGWDPNQRDNRQVTLLHLSRRFNRKKIAELLIEYGAKKNLINASGLVPLTYYYGKSDLYFYRLFGGLSYIKKMNSFNLEYFIKKSADYKRASILNEIGKYYPLVSQRKEFIRRKELAHIWSCEEKYADYSGWYENPCYKFIIRSALNFFGQPWKKEQWQTLQKEFISKLKTGLKSMGKKFHQTITSTLSDINSGRPVILLSGWGGHCTSYVVLKNKIVKINRGENCHLFKIELFEMQNPENLDASLLQQILEGSRKELFLYEINQILKLQFRCGVTLSEQRIGNCVAATTKTTVLALLFLLLYELGIDNSLELAKIHYKEWNKYLLKNAYYSYLKNTDNLDNDLVAKIRKKSPRKKIQL